MYGAVWGWCHNSFSNPSTFFQGPDRFDVVFFSKTIDVRKKQLDIILM